MRLTRDQAEKLEFHNTMGGIMVATSTGGSITGKRLVDLNDQMHQVEMELYQSIGHTVNINSPHLTALVSSTVSLP